MSARTAAPISLAFPLRIPLIPLVSLILSISSERVFQYQTAFGNFPLFTAGNLRSATLQIEASHFCQTQRIPVEMMDLAVNLIGAIFLPLPFVTKPIGAWRKTRNLT